MNAEPATDRGEVLSATARRRLAAGHAIAGAAALGGAAVVPAGLRLAGLVAGISLLVAALYHTASGLRLVARRRAEADRLLAAIDAPRVPEPLRWRADELTAGRERKALARALTNLLKSLELPPSLFPVPVNRLALYRNRRIVESLVARLTALDRPVRVRGILLVRQLLGDGHHSPLYDVERAADLRAALVRARAEIEPH